MTETEEQIIFVKWFRQRYPGDAKALRTSMNGLTMPGGRKWGAIIWNKMRALGLTVGEPDIIITTPRGGFCGLAIEHKANGQARKITPEQIDHLNYLAGQGYLCVETRGIDLIQQITEDYMDAKADRLR